MGRKILTALLLLSGCLYSAAAWAQASCSTTYTAACIGATVCFPATGTSSTPVPQNLNRRYLLIQSQSATLPVYFAIVNPPSSGPPVAAVIGTNTFALVPPGNSQLPNYEVSSLNATATPPPRVPNGAISLITGGTSIQVCITENNG